MPGLAALACPLGLQHSLIPRRSLQGWEAMGAHVVAPAELSHQPPGTLPFLGKMPSYWQGSVLSWEIWAGAGLHLLPLTPTNSLETLLGVEDHMRLLVEHSYMYDDWNMCLHVVSYAFI